MRPTAQTKIARSAFLTACVAAAVVLSGCTSSQLLDETKQAQQVDSTEVETPVAGTSGQAGWQTELPDTPPRGPRTGNFISQAAATSGAVALETDADGRLLLTFTDFSTADVPDLRVNLNEGALFLDSNGEYQVDHNEPTSAVLELGPLASIDGDQSYDVTAVSNWLTRTQSITVFDYRNKRDMGSVAVGPF